MYSHVEAEKTLYRYRQMIRTFLEIKPYGDGGQDVVETAVQQAAYRGLSMNGAENWDRKHTAKSLR